DHTVEGLQIVSNECRFQDQVLWWIAGDRELGEENDVGALVPRASNPVDDELRVARQIANRRVDLSQPDPQIPVHNFMVSRIYSDRDLLRTPARALPGPSHARVRRPRPGPRAHRGRRRGRAAPLPRGGPADRGARLLLQAEQRVLGAVRP